MVFGQKSLEGHQRILCVDLTSSEVPESDYTEATDTIHQEEGEVVEQHE